MPLLTPSGASGFSHYCRPATNLFWNQFSAGTGALSFWMKPNFASDVQHATPLGAVGTSSGGFYFNNTVASNAPRARIILFGRGSYAFTSSIANNNYNWVFFVLNCLSTTSFVFYNNGNQQPAVTTGAFISQTASNFQIFGHNASTATTRFIGSLAEVALYNDVLSLEDIRSLLRRTTTPDAISSCDYYWPMTDTSVSGLAEQIVGGGTYDLVITGDIANETDPPRYYPPNSDLLGPLHHKVWYQRV